MRGSADCTVRALSIKIHGPCPGNERGPTGPLAAGWVVVGKTGRGPAGHFDEKGAVHKAVEFVEKAGCRVIGGRGLVFSRFLGKTVYLVDFVKKNVFRTF